MRIKSARLAAPALIALVALGACTPLRTHTGYVVDADLVNSVQPGVDNRQSVLAVLGKPSFASQFNQGDWYYVSRDSRNFAFNTPHAKEQLTLRITFDPAGNVTAVYKGGVEQVASISPYGKKTPTLGKERNFFDELFGNIGTVGAAGVGGQGGGDNGGRDTP
ncbi:MAG: cell envelope protein SmpA [Sphingomonas bacterium]|jgi:outer membrane protein assembly factor BamE (lipoprotein component of BamABCDE complex)|uniref:outer membrane protein assembly factor BamE n=1 Tax=Sphingomonas bacterium TaxID=1895847 RepID=UPI00261948CD|nr:outer membrane protein assembly factor BamE [Sphingomonas bacterium]MDB5710470.1 cell envelope protein SmpA [Sphingomonas bacterium]